METYLSSQRRRLDLSQIVHLKRPSPSLVFVGLCNETMLDVVATSLLFVFSKPLDCVACIDEVSKSPWSIASWFAWKGGTTSTDQDPMGALLGSL